MRRGLLERELWNKKGLELAINTVVILVLAILLLLFLILFFTDAGKNFLASVGLYAGYSNVDNVIANCNILYDTKRNYEFCCEKKNVRYYENNEKLEKEFTCNDLINKSFINNKINDLDCGEISC